MTKELELRSRSLPQSETLMALAALLPVLLIFAFAPILIKVSEYEISPNATIFNRLWIATAVLGCWNGVSLLKRRWSGKPIAIELFPQAKNFLFLLLLVGVFSLGQQLLYARSLTQTSAANSEVLHSLTPLFTTLVGWIFLAQKFDRLFLMGMAIATIASIALVANDFSITLDKLQGDGLALLSAIFWAGYLLVLEKLQTQLSTNAITLWTCLLGTVFLLPILLVSGDDLFPHSWGVWLTVIIMGSIEILAKILLTYSLKGLSSGLVATILLLHPVITAILAWRIFSETLNLLNLLAFFAILLGAYLATSSKGGVKAT